MIPDSNVESKILQKKRALFEAANIRDCFLLNVYLPSNYKGELTLSHKKQICLIGSYKITLPYNKQQNQNNKLHFPQEQENSSELIHFHAIETPS
jgi:hypothetical protein